MLRLFNEPKGREYLVSEGVPEETVNHLDLAGLSGIGNILSAIKFSKYYELTKNDHNVMDTYGMALIGVKDFAKADLIIRQAIQEAKNKGQAVLAEFYLHRAQALVGLGQLAEARDVLHRELARIGASRADQYDQEIGEAMNQLLEEMSAQEEAELDNPL